MDMRRVDVSARLGTTEIWQIENVVGMDHPFHLHGFRFQVLDRVETALEGLFQDRTGRRYLRKQASSG